MALMVPLGLNPIIWNIHNNQATIVHKLTQLYPKMKIKGHIFISALLIQQTTENIE